MRTRSTADRLESGFRDLTLSIRAQAPPCTHPTEGPDAWSQSEAHRARTRFRLSRALGLRSRTIPATWHGDAAHADAAPQLQRCFEPVQAKLAGSDEKQAINQKRSEAANWDSEGTGWIGVRACGLRTSMCSGAAGSAHLALAACTSSQARKHARDAKTWHADPIDPAKHDNVRTWDCGTD